MAELTSLGVHNPVALPCLIKEGILPEHPPQDSYRWETYVFDGEYGEVEEEIAVTKTCVTWSQGKFTRNVYRFDLEGEEVIQAILTHFPSAGRLVSDDIRKTKAQSNGHENAGPHVAQANGIPVEANGFNESVSHDSATPARALIVFLKSKAHIYFLNGASHVIDLPFEVARAFPAPRGAILQRKTSPPPLLPPTPRMPAAPPNSFFSSQIPASSSYLQSPTIAKSFASTRTSRPSPLRGKKGLDALFNDLPVIANDDAEEDVAALYSLTNPLSDLGVVSHSVQHIKPRLSSKTPPGLSVDFEPLDASENVVYVSADDELASGRDNNHGPLTLLATANNDTQVLAIWHAWYIDERSLASLLKQRQAHKAAKARRRSSFLGAAMGTGTTTPAARQKEGTRESFAGVAPIRLPGEPTSSHPSAAPSRKPTRQEEEEAMASQMDPDYQPTASQQLARESRRISSLNADVRASQHAVAASFGGTGGRRNTSFGGPNERRSFGHRKSRGSTPGSVLNRSLGADDDLMDVDSSIDADSEETVDAIVRHIRATYEATGAESLFGNTEEGFKRELVVRKLHSFQLPGASTCPGQTASNIRVVCLRDRDSSRSDDGQRLNIYVQESTTKDLVCLGLRVVHKALWPDLSSSKKVAIPLVLAESKLGKCADLVKVKDRGLEAIILANRGVIYSLEDNPMVRLPEATEYRMYDQLYSSLQGGDIHMDAGKNRKVQRPVRGALKFANPGANSRCDELGDDRVHHRLRMNLRPTDRYIDRLLEVCEFVLPTRYAQVVRGLWCQVHNSLTRHPERMSGTAPNVEWVAFTTTVFFFYMSYLDPKARAALNVSRVAAGPTSTRLNVEVSKSISGRAAWSWIDEQQIPTSEPEPRRDLLVSVAAALADEISHSAMLSSTSSLSLTPLEAEKLMLGLHIYHEEQKLSTFSLHDNKDDVLPIIIAQVGSWMGLPAWSYDPGQYYHFEGADERRWVFIKSSTRRLPQMPLMDEPVGVLHWFEHAMTVQSTEKYPTLDVIASLESVAPMSNTQQNIAVGLTPRIASLSNIVAATVGLSTSAETTLELMTEHGITTAMIETSPEAIAAPFRNAISICEKEPPTTWSRELLLLVSRDDLTISEIDVAQIASRKIVNVIHPLKDVQTICHALEQVPHSARTKEANRHAVSQLIFSEDRRLVEATSLMHYNSAQVAECERQPDWTDAFHFEQQRKVMQWVTIRMIALPAGDAMLHYDSQTLLLTDKYHTPGFSNSCLMQPMGHTLTTDRSGLTEEKVNWAYFHAGVSAGLRISRKMTGIDTSWIAFNKPNELTNRHAGLLLALGLSGHLRHLAKWLSFKYLTPKHTMTSVGLLLGLSASYMGSMDGLITRMLSVHITRMLPPGAAELNVSPITQTAGLVGIGLLYYNTQHRRMSEIVLSEVEHMELEDPDSGPDPLRDESYRLAAGFALGYINLGKGKDLRGLHGMYLPERLLAIAVGPRPVHAVHVFDRATAGAVIAIALVYMKSGDQAVARKIDIPDTEAQFDHVRPDLLMLRVMAKHLILWDTINITRSIDGRSGWIRANLPQCYQSRIQVINSSVHPSSVRQTLKSSDVPFFNILTGLAWVLSLRYAGSGNANARDEILLLLDYFYKIKSGADAYYYDAKLARSTVRRCIDVLALAAATIMAGTGDLETFRYLRRLHGRTDAETPYGSHLAAHLAIGVLFLGGGTFTFGTSNLAIASLICAFYPLFPTDVHDNHVHLQAFRHFWVFAAEARCLVVEEVDTHRPIAMPVIVTLTDGSMKSITAPCLLPELDNIATVQTNDPAYWRVTLDFVGNPEHLAAFRKDQRIFVRRCPASEAHNSVFSATLAAMNDVQSFPASNQRIWRSVFNLPVFKELDKADIELILPPDVHSTVHTDERGTVVDDRLVLANAVVSPEKEALWNLRVLFAWAEKARDEGQGKPRWIGNEVIEALKAKIDERLRAM